MLGFTLCAFFIGAAAVQTDQKIMTLKSRNLTKFPLPDGVNILPFAVYGEVKQSVSSPFQVMIQSYLPGFGWYRLCSGVIIGYNQVLSTALSLFGFDNPGLVRVVAGMPDLTKPPTSTTQFRKVLRLIPHEEASASDAGNVNDVEILVLKDPLVYNKNVQPATIDVSSPFGRKDCEISTWGGGIITKENITLRPRGFCEPFDPNFGWSANYTQHVCGDGEATNGRSCGIRGDPLVCGKRQKLLVGLISESVCDTFGVPNYIFVILGAFVDWLKHQQSMIDKDISRMTINRK